MDLLGINSDDKTNCCGEDSNKITLPSQDFMVYFQVYLQLDLEPIPMQHLVRYPLGFQVICFVWVPTVG